MKHLTTGFTLLFGFMLIFTACTEEKNPAQQYGNTLGQSLKSAKNVDDKAHADAARKAIQDFYATKGRYPADLAEVSAAIGIPLAGDKYDYNAETGTLTAK